MNWKENNLIRRVIMAFLGNYIISFGISFLYPADFGTDPFTCMNLGVSSHLPISLGTYQLLINIVLFAIIFVFDRRSFGIGAIINMVLLGYMIEFNVFWTDKLGINAENFADKMVLRIILLSVAVLIAACGCGIYMSCDLGAAPWDRLGQVFEMKSNGKIKYRYVRMVYDCTAIAIGYFTGATVGVATFFFGFFAGPLISFFGEHVGKKVVGYVPSDKGDKSV